MEIKIIITGIQKVNKSKLALKLTELNDNLSIMPTFTTDENYEGIDENFHYKMDLNTIYLAYKNNALLYVNTINNISKGITLDDYYNNDIGIIDINDLNMIPDKQLLEDNVLIVWIDSKFNKNIDLYEIKYLQQRLTNYKYLYFLENENIDDIANIILEYLNCDDDKRIELLENNS
jgi:hypothetical protein